MARSEWVCDDKIKLILALLTRPNELAVECSLRYGLRIGDVLALKTEAVKKGRFSIREEKTAKRRTVTLSTSFQQRLLSISGRVYVFEHRLSPCEHRTRQAVYADVKRAAKALRIVANFTPHSARKSYAVHQYISSHYNIKKVQSLLNHSDEAVTMVYALADKLTKLK